MAEAVSDYIKDEGIIGRHITEYAEEIGFCSTKYELIELQ